MSYPCHGRGKDKNFDSSAPIFCNHALARVELSHLRQVEPADLEKFYSEYGTLLKVSMSTLRKRDKKREKLRAEELGKKRKRLMEEVVISGPKRGAGRRKRKRLIASAVKLGEFKKKATGKVAEFKKAAEKVPAKVSTS